MSSEIDLLKVDIELTDVVSEKRAFTTFKALSDFMVGEHSFWQEKIGDLAGNQPMGQLIKAARNASQEITNFRNSYTQWDESTREQQLGTIRGRLQQYAKAFIFSSSPFGIAFVDACRFGHQQAHAFWIVVTNANNGQLPAITAQYVEGAIFGYEFLHQDESVIYKRRESEKRAFVALRNTLSDQTDKIVGQIDDFKRQLDEWKTTSQQDLATDRECYKNEQHDFLSSSADKLDTQLANDKGEREVFFANAKKQVEDMEALYREKLRLEPAATYWNKRALELRKAGRGWGALLALTTVAVGYGFAELFREWMKSGQALKEFSAMHWQGVVLFIATLTMFIYLIRVLGKMTFSSFHLQRDAEERELLTYLYLALSEKGNVETASRQVVLQSLFSRAETGLLSGDHGPTIPVAEVVQKIKS